MDPGSLGVNGSPAKRLRLTHSAENLYREHGYEKVSECALSFLLTSPPKNTIMIVHTDPLRMENAALFQGLGIVQTPRDRFAVEKV
jgi:hypothetical protein